MTRIRGGMDLSSLIKEVEKLVKVSYERNTPYMILENVFNDVIDKLLSLLKIAPELMFYFDANHYKCIYYDHRGWFSKSNNEGSNRIYDPGTDPISKEDARKLLKEWLEKGKVWVEVAYVTPTYKNGVDWFT